MTDRDNVDLDRRLHRVLTTPVRRHTRLNESMDSMDSIASMAVGMAKLERDNSSTAAEQRRFSLLGTSTNSSGGDSNGLPLLLPTNSSPNLKLTTSEPDLSGRADDDPDSIGGSMRLPGRSSNATPPPSSPPPSKPPKDTSVTIDNDMYPGYSLVTVSCQDRNALLFDTVQNPEPHTLFHRVPISLPPLDSKKKAPCEHSNEKWRLVGCALRRVCVCCAHSLASYCGDRCACCLCPTTT